MCLGSGSGKLLLLLAIWIALLSRPRPCWGQLVITGAAAVATTSRQFVAALQDSSVTAINLTSSLSITPDVWMRTAASSTHRIHVDRPLTVRGVAAGGAAVTVDLNFMKRRLMLTSDYVMTFENLVFRGCRQPSAISTAGLDFLSLRAVSMHVAWGACMLACWHACWPVHSPGKPASAWGQRG